MNPYAYPGLPEYIKCQVIGIIKKSSIHRDVIKKMYNIACDITGCNNKDIKLRTRKSEAVEARRLVIYYLRSNTSTTLVGMSTPFEINHATALHHYRKMKGFLIMGDTKSRENYSEFRKRIDVLLK
jgi:chromosomal replication initiation ATPase DnaA